MAQRYIAQDLGGFGRLADMEVRLRGEDRADQEASMRKQLQTIQLKQSEMNIAELGRRNKIKTELGLLNKNLPEGENRFTASYKYLMGNDPEMADKYMNAQSDKIEGIHKLDKKGAVRVFNDTIGKVMGTTLEQAPDIGGKKNLYKAFDKKTGEQSYMERVGGKFKIIPNPEGYDLTDPTEEKKGMFTDYTLEDKKELARKYNVTQKLPFTGRSDEIKAINAEIVKLALAEEGIKGKDAVETFFASKDIEGMTKDINAQQKKLGSMRSFSLNIDKQADKINETIDKIFRMDVKILNHPINKIMTDYVGDADRATLAVFVGELTEEIGKLASGATDSVAALSEGGREKWDRIINLDLPAKALKGLISETKELAKMRVDSMLDSLKISKNIRAGRPSDHGLGEEKPPINDRGSALQAENPDASVQEIAKMLKEEGY